MSLLESLNVRVVGKGDKVVVLAHGLGCEQSVWQHVVPHLVDDYRVVLFDLMGAGSTDPEGFSFAKYSMLHGYADDLLQLLDELEVEQCKYIGHSMSGMIGLLASIDEPEKFERVITISASPRYLNESCNYYGGFEQSDLNSLFDAMSSNYQSWVAGFAPLALDDDVESPAVQEFSRTFFSVRPDIALALAKTCFQSDLRGMLKQVTVPVHILQSNRDLAVPISVAIYISENLVEAKNCVEIFNGVTGHIPQLSGPDVVIPVLRRHLELQM